MLFTRFWLKIKSNDKIVTVIPVKLNEKLKILRKQKNLSQEQIAEYLGVGQTTYSRYEDLKTYPDIFIIKKLANLYGITIDQLVSDIDEEEYTIKVTEEERVALNNLVKKINTANSIRIESNINITNNNQVNIGVLNKNDKIEK